MVNCHQLIFVKMSRDPDAGEEIGATRIRMWRYPRQWVANAWACPIFSSAARGSRGGLRKAETAPRWGGGRARAFDPTRQTAEQPTTSELKAPISVHHRFVVNEGPTYPTCCDVERGRPAGLPRRSPSGLVKVYQTQTRG